MSIIVTHKRSFITKSRSGHYTVTVKEIGTWQLDGRTYPYENVVFKQGKIELAVAQRLAAEHTMPQGVECV